LDISKINNESDLARNGHGNTVIVITIYYSKI